VDTKFESSSPDSGQEEYLFLLGQARRRDAQADDLPSVPDLAGATEATSPLLAQLGKYPPNEHGHGVSDLNAESREILYHDIEKYQRNPLNQPTDKYRKQLISLIEAKVQDAKTDCKVSDEIKKTTPESATREMKDLLGPEGLKIYKLALKEEMHTKEYRDAVFNASTKYIGGPSLQTKPFIIIAGPSGCGKSFATDMILQQVSQFPKSPDGREGNLIACVDGGIGRQVSQMRKLVIRAANLKGYTGVKDLHDQSDILDDIKGLVSKTALNERQFGLVMPETYSNWMFPLVGHKKHMEDISVSNRQLIFGLVQGHDPRNFQEVVAHMGKTRAWKTDGFRETTLDLNSTAKLCESKAYGPGGFIFGLNGSHDASEASVKIQKKLKLPVLTIGVVNDLILLRRVESSAGEVWEPAESGQPGVVMVSEIAFTRWNALGADTKASQGLLEFAKANKQPMVVTSKDFNTLANYERLRNGVSDMRRELRDLRASATPGDPVPNSDSEPGPDQTSPPETGF